MVTWNAAKTCNLGDTYGIEDGRDANLVVLESPTASKPLPAPA